MTHTVLLRTRLSIACSFSLKDKRRVIRSVKDKIRNRFNVSVAETDCHELHNLTELSIVTISSDISRAESIIHNVINLLENHPEAVLETLSTERL